MLGIRHDPGLLVDGMEALMNSKCRFRFSMANALVLELHIGGVSGHDGERVFRFPWRIREPYGCPALGLGAPHRAVTRRAQRTSLKGPAFRQGDRLVMKRALDSSTSPPEAFTCHIRSRRTAPDHGDGRFARVDKPASRSFAAATS